MAKANNTDIYKFDEYPSLIDYLFGTDANDYKKNKSYRLNSIIQLINGVNGKNNLQFIFSDGSNPEATYFNKGFFFTDTNQGNPTGFAKLIFNKESLQPVNLTELFVKMSTMKDLIIKLENPSDPNIFFRFSIANIQNETDYFVLDVVVFEDFYFGELVNETIYSVYFDIKIDALNKLDKGSYIGTAEDLNIDIQNLKNPDIVLKNVTPTISGLNISASADSFEWRINQVVFDNTPALSAMLTPASDGFYRKDALLGTNTNNYLIVEGAEGDESVTPPTVFPEGTILLGNIDIFGNTVGGFSINDTSRTYVYGNGGATDYVEVTKLGTTLEIMNATSLTGFTIPAKNIQYGKDYYLRNSTGGVLNLKSATGTNGIRFYFPDGDLVVPVNNNVHLKYLSNGEFGGLGYFTLVGIDYKNKADKTYVNEALDTKVDKVNGKSLISDDEITRLATVTNQDISGKEDIINKGIASGYVPLDEFSKIAHQFLSIVNNLTTGGTTSLLSAEQGVVLQTQINNINVLLASDNVNLDNVQELVDAIESLQVSLNTILVNDLTTGGITKALTAEMGKSLKILVDSLATNKLDKGNYIGTAETLSYQSKIYENNDLQIFRKPGTPPDPENKEPNIGDWCIGFVEGQFINAEYLGPDKAFLTSFNI